MSNDMKKVKQSTAAVLYYIPIYPTKNDILGVIS